MPERYASILIFLGGLAAVLALWYLSYRAVRWDTRRQGMKEWQRKAWITATVALPLLGFAVYLFVRVLRQYLTPQQQPEAAEEWSLTDLKARASGAVGSPWEQQEPMSIPAWQAEARVGSNGTQGQKTPSTIPARVMPAAGRFVLVVSGGPLAGQQFVLKRFPARIGRGPGADIAMDADLNVSRVHAEVYEWNGELRVRDLGSTHGTQVNAVPIQDETLQAGDRITIGSSELTLHELP